MSITAGWMKTPLGTEVHLGPGRIVLDGVPALLERGTAAPRFSAYVYCGHGRPSQLLLSCCSLSQCHQKLACFHLHDLHHSPVKADCIYTV